MTVNANEYLNTECGTQNPAGIKNESINAEY
jgi:hypothetical protein